MKIICAGFPKTGTKSMAMALRELGYENVHDFEVIKVKVFEIGYMLKSTFLRIFLICVFFNFLRNIMSTTLTTT